MQHADPSDRSGPGRGLVLAAWVAGFAVGTVSHVVDLATGGYPGRPLPVRLFWMSLTLLDPLAALLLLRHRRAGVALALCVMAVDVPVNWAVVATTGEPAGGVVRLSLFGALLAGTAPVLWRWFGHRRPPAREIAPGVADRAPCGEAH